MVFCSFLAHVRPPFLHFFELLFMFQVTAALTFDGREQKLCDVNSCFFSAIKLPHH
jgi:hypothetical protein